MGKWGTGLKQKLDRLEDNRRETAIRQSKAAEAKARDEARAATKIQSAHRGRMGRRKAKRRKLLPKKAPAVAADSPALVRIAKQFGETEVHNTKRAPAEITCVISKKGALGLVWKPRTVPAPPPASPCRLFFIEPKAKGARAEPPLRVGMWLTHVQDQPVVDFFSAVNRVNKAKRPI